MSDKTKIQWSDATWSPLRARVKTDAVEIATRKGYTSLVQFAGKMAGHIGPHCERVSHGCDNCYSDTNNGRCLPANGTGLPFDRRSRDLIEPFVDEKILLQPLKWRKAKRIFVENQSDLFGEWNTDEMIDRVFAVMALDYDMHWSEKDGNVRQPHHNFQVLTKRPDRMLAYISRIVSANKHAVKNWFDLPLVRQAVDISMRKGDCLPGNASIPVIQWVADGMPGLWLGVSVEDQKTADERIPILLQTPAAKRFVSYEPALGTVDFRNLTFDMSGVTHELVANRVARGEMVTRESYENYPKALSVDSLTGANMATELPGLDWIIVGGESGPGARPFNIAWARQTVKQCKAAGVACFVKQFGAKPFQGIKFPNGDPGKHVFQFKDRKGGDMAEWPEDLRVREFPYPQPIVPAATHRSDEFHDPEPEK